jgi:hypothetical protein
MKTSSFKAEYEAKEYDTKKLSQTSERFEIIKNNLVDFISKNSKFLKVKIEGNEFCFEEVINNILIKKMKFNKIYVTELRGEIAILIMTVCNNAVMSFTYKAKYGFAIKEVKGIDSDSETFFAVITTLKDFFETYNSSNGEQFLLKKAK